MADQVTADSEMLEFFIEEAQEVLADIHKCVAEGFPVESITAEPLKDLRRFYHTLKGSGRMVGATTIADLAWPIEEALTLISEGKAVLDERLQPLVTDAANMIPVMIDDLQNQREHTVDYMSLVAIAKSISFPAESQAAASPAAPAAAEIPAPAAAEIQAPAPVAAAQPQATAENQDELAAFAEKLAAALERIASLEATVAEQQKTIEFNSSALGEADTAFTGFSEQLGQLEAARSQADQVIESVRRTAENAAQSAAAAEQATRQFIAKQEEAASLRNESDEISKLGEEVSGVVANVDGVRSEVGALREAVEAVQSELSSPAAAAAEPAVNAGLLYGLIAVVGLVAIVGCIL